MGDVVGHPMFAHWATAQGLAFARKLLGQPTRFPTPAINSAVIFSMPEVGIAGLTEKEARVAGHDVGIARYDYRADARAQVSGHAEDSSNWFTTRQPVQCWAFTFSWKGRRPF